MLNSKMHAAIFICATSLAVTSNGGEYKSMDKKSHSSMESKKDQGTVVHPQHTGKMSAEQMIQNWPAKPKEAAMMLMKKYGSPQEATAERLIWSNNGPFKRTILTRQEHQHDFPVPHTDFMEQVINYKVPADKFDDLAMFDGSVMAERTTGELSARCDKEENNLLGLNLANAIITGKRSAADARTEFTNTIAKSMGSKELPPMMQKLQFEVKSASMMDPDKVTLAPTQMSKGPE